MLMLAQVAVVLKMGTVKKQYFSNLLHSKKFHKNTKINTNYIAQTVTYWSKQLQNNNSIH